MSKLEYPVWGFAIVLCAVVLPPGLAGLDLAVLLFRGSFAAYLTLLALSRSQSSSGSSDGVRQVRFGAGLGILGTVLAAVLLLYWTQSFLSSGAAGWIPVLAASLLLSLGMKVHGSGSTAAWRQWVSFAAANRAAASGKRADSWPPVIACLAAVTVLRDGLESVLYIPALLLYGNKGELLAGMIGGAALLVLSARLVPRLPGRRPLRRLSCLMPALTLFLSFRLLGEGILLLQRKGIMEATPAGWWVFPTTWEWIAAEAFLLFAVGGAAFRFRKRSNEFIRQINL